LILENILWQVLLEKDFQFLKVDILFWKKTFRQATLQVRFHHNIPESVKFLKEAFKES